MCKKENNATEENKNFLIIADNEVSNKKEYNHIKFCIDIEKENIHLNFKLPIKILKLIGNMGNLSEFIDDDSVKKISDNGYNIRSIDLTQIIKDIEFGNLKNPVLCNIDVMDGGRVRILIYVD